MRGSPEEAVARQRDRIARLEERQQTTPLPLSLPEEGSLLEELRQAREALGELENALKKHRRLLHEVGELDATIDGLFRQAEAEHATVLALSEEVMAMKDDLEERDEGLSLLEAEADRMHRAFLAAREKGDRYHARAAEMREKILSLHRARGEEAQEAREIMETRRQATRQALEDEEAVDEAVEEALSILQDKRKLEL